MKRLLLLVTISHWLFSLSAFEGFIADTLVYGPRGYKAIADIVAGDEVISYNYKGDCVSRPVLEVKKEMSPVTIKVCLETEVLYVAPNQKFYVLNEITPRWTQAQDMKPGDTLLRHCGYLAQVIKVERLPLLIDVYDLNVEEFNNYCVGNSVVLVHNFVPAAAVGAVWTIGAGVEWFASIFFAGAGLKLGYDAANERAMYAKWEREDKFYESHKPPVSFKDDDNEYKAFNQQTDSQLKKSYKSIKSLIQKHNDKLAEYLEDPVSCDHKGLLDRGDKVRESVLNARPRHLSTETTGFERQLKVIEKIMRERGL